ncbi:biotin/lipoyl-containing protein [Nocardioides sp. Bht2]|uniref:biotin/lipoyl-containing protein n=1 Tax=Nocardioides sp. Bht2 TaxID=3392297 RepID=UPI0039B63C8E
MLSAPATDLEVSAPFHGTVTLLVACGDELEAGAPVAVLEALKLESMLTAPVAGTVTGTVQDAVSGDDAVVSGGDVIITLRRR